MFKSWLSGCLIGLALLAAAPLWADETLPPPRRAPSPPPPPRRAERIDKLRKLGGQLVDTLAADPQLTPKPLDVPRLNEALLLLLEPLLGQERAIESLHLGFDPAATNFARDTIKLRADARLKHTGWSANPTQVNLGATARMARNPSGAQQAMIVGELHLETDVIPLANRAIARLLSRPDRGTPAPGSRPPTADEDFQARLREKLQRTPPLASLDDLVDLAVYISGLQLTATNEHIDRLKHQVLTARDEQEGAAAQAELDKSRLRRDQMFDVHPHVEHDERGHAIALMYAMHNSSVPESGRINQFELTIREREIHLVADGVLLQGVEFYALFKPLVMNTLERLQNRDADTLRLGRTLIRDSLSRVRPLLFGEPPAPAAGALPGPADPLNGAPR